MIALSHLQATIHAKTAKISNQSDFSQNGFKKMVEAYLRIQIKKQIDEPQKARIILPANILHGALYT